MDRAFEFYRQVLGMVEVYRGTNFIQAQTPGSRDVLVFEQVETVDPRAGGIRHFGFRLTDVNDIEQAIFSVRKAGGTVLRSGEFCPGEPYVFFEDLDGYEVEIWHELPTKADPVEETGRIGRPAISAQTN